MKELLGAIAKALVDNPDQAGMKLRKRVNVDKSLVGLSRLKCV
jgi:hypothetical protein